MNWCVPRTPPAYRGWSFFSKGWRVWFLPWLTALLLCAASPQSVHADILTYIIAHRCNGETNGTDVVSARGVNAIEADFSYAAPTAFDAQEWLVVHDTPTAFSTKLQPWLNSVATAPGTLALVIFDIKTPEGPLQELYDKARATLPPDLRLLFSIGGAIANNTGDNFAKLTYRVQNDPLAGISSDEIDSPYEVETYLYGYGYNKIWYGDGVFAAGSSSRVTTNVNNGLALRGCGIKGVYTWTYEAESSIKSWLNAGVNGIFVNAPECFGYASPATAWDPALAVAYAKTLAGHTFATRTDDPFATPSSGCDVYVDSEAPAGGNGTSSAPFNNLDDALLHVAPGNNLHLEARTTEYIAPQIDKPEISIRQWGTGDAIITAP